MRKGRQAGGGPLAAGCGFGSLRQPASPILQPSQSTPPLAAIHDCCLATLQGLGFRKPTPHAIADCSPLSNKGKAQLHADLAAKVAVRCVLLQITQCCSTLNPKP